MYRIVVLALCLTLSIYSLCLAADTGGIETARGIVLQTWEEIFNGNPEKREV